MNLKVKYPRIEEKPGEQQQQEWDDKLPREARVARRYTYVSISVVVMR